MDAACRRAGAPLLFGVAALVVGCGDFDERNDIDSSDVELRNQGEDETGGLEPEGDGVEPGVIPGHYIVMMKKGADPQAAAAAVQAAPEHVFTHGITGFAGPLNHGQLVALSHRKDVELIEPDGIVTAAVPPCPDTCPDPVTQYKTPQNNAPAYSVDRLDQCELPFSNTYTYACSGEEVNAYVFDTWMETDHWDFGGRASAGYDGYPNEPSNGESCSGHATHVAGILGGTKYGVAKNVNLISVEVLDCTGHGSWSKLLAGIDWVLANKGDTLAVANMSLSGRKSYMVNWAVNDLAESGVFVAVAAGNNDDNACKYSPAGASGVVAVAANNSNDQRASFSNSGLCVDIYAGGTNVLSAWPGGGSTTGSGTSMSSPHVAGAAALYKSTFGDAASDQIKADLQAWAHVDMISGNPSNTLNLALHWPCSGAVPCPGS